LTTGSSALATDADWASAVDAAPEDIPCEPTPGIDPIAHGNISIMVD
jgi:hypothetical protein